jgi:pyrroloquinoline quinone (PQQ) biosynthesis protein C
MHAIDSTAVNESFLSYVNKTDLQNTASAHIEFLKQEALNHRAINHIYLVKLAQGDLPNLEKALQDFAYQYAYYSSYFPRYLALTLSKLNNPVHRASIITNLSEESGFIAPQEKQALLDAGIELCWIEGIPHPELFKRFTKSICSTSEQGDALEAICWRELVLSTLSSVDEAEAVGIIGLGTEHIVKHIYHYILSAIKLHGKISRQDSIFFELHCLVDDDHAESLHQISCDLAQTEEGRKRLHMGMIKALNIRAVFWDSMLERALRF